MKKSELFDRCVFQIEQLLNKRKLRLKKKCNELPQTYFVSYRKLFAGIIISSSEGEAGTITRAWGVAYVDPDQPQRCTEIHTSYYGESVALGKLWDELDKLEQQSK